MESYCSPSWRALLSSFTHSSWAYGLAEGEAAQATLSACSTAHFHPARACLQPSPPPKQLFPRLPTAVWGPAAPRPLAWLLHPAPHTPTALPAPQHPSQHPNSPPSTPTVLPSTGAGAQASSQVLVRRAICSALLTMLKHYTAAHASGACPFALCAKYSFSGAGSSGQGAKLVPGAPCLPWAPFPIPSTATACFNMLLLSNCFSIVNSTWEI